MFCYPVLILPTIKKIDFGDIGLWSSFFCHTALRDLFQTFSDMIFELAPLSLPSRGVGLLEVSPGAKLVLCAHIKPSFGRIWSFQ